LRSRSCCSTPTPHMVLTLDGCASTRAGGWASSECGPRAAG
jgi:hypothetical protein